MIEDYFAFLKRIAKKSPEVVHFRLIREFVGVDSGFIRFALDLRDGCDFMFLNTLIPVCIKSITHITG
jgi:hypothetical protein